MENKKTKFDLKKAKDNTIKSLKEVEIFLNKLKKINKGKNLYKILKNSKKLYGNKDKR